MYVRAFRAANTAAQEARALQAFVSKQRQTVTKDSLDQVKRLDVQGHGRQMRELHQQRVMAAIDAETARSKSLGNAIISALAVVGTAVTAAVMFGQRLADRASGTLNIAEEARMQEEAGRKGGPRLALATYNRDRAKQRVEVLQRQMREKEGRAWFPGLGPGFGDRQQLARATDNLAKAQQAVYDAGGELNAPTDRERRAPHLGDGADSAKPPVATARDQPPVADRRDAGAPLPVATAPEQPPETGSPPAGKPMTPEEEKAAYPCEDPDFMKAVTERRRQAGHVSGTAPAAAAEVLPPQTLAEHGSAAFRAVADRVGKPLMAGIGWMLDLIGSDLSFANTTGKAAATEAGKPAAIATSAAADCRAATLPAQPAVTTGDRTMPLTAPGPDPQAARQWGTSGAQPLPLPGTPAERLHALMEAGRKGELTRGMIQANQNLFSADSLVRLQAGLLSDLGAAHNGRSPSGAVVGAELQATLDRALGYGQKGALSPAMRDAMVKKAAGNLLDAIDAFKADPSAAHHEAYDRARRDYEDLKYGDLTVDGKVQATGLLHLLGAEMKQALEPMDLVDPETGKREGDMTARLLSAVELARNTAEAAIKEDLAAREFDALAAKAIAMIRKAEAGAGMYGVGPGVGGGGGR
jgi:hypothetical protein